jgi:hypothetical protein
VVTGGRLPAWGGARRIEEVLAGVSPEGGKEEEEEENMKEEEEREKVKRRMIR